MSNCLFLYICFCHCYPGCWSTLAAYYAKQLLIRDDFVGSLKNQWFGGKCMTKTASAGTHREALSRLLMAAILPSTYKLVKLNIQYKIICTIVLFYCLKFIMFYSLGTVLQHLKWGVGIFGFCHFLGWFFGFSVSLSIAVSSFSIF